MSPPRCPTYPIPGHTLSSRPIRLLTGHVVHTSFMSRHRRFPTAGSGPTLPPLGNLPERSSPTRRVHQPSSCTPNTVHTAPGQPRPPHCNLWSPPESDTAQGRAHRRLPVNVRGVTGGYRDSAGLEPAFCRARCPASPGPRFPGSPQSLLPHSGVWVRLREASCPSHFPLPMQTAWESGQFHTWGLLAPRQPAPSNVQLCSFDPYCARRRAEAFDLVAASALAFL